ncbi:MAG: hypothetical protein ABEK01_01725 [Candidatus Nanohaloarchaea archaeon]
MICVLALLTFGILGIFSATHRKTAMEALECIRSRVRREPCETGLDERLQASIVGRVLDRSPLAAKYLNRYFEVITWLMVIALLISGIFAGLGLYNWAVHGNCHGPESEKGCTLEKLKDRATGSNSSETSMERHAPGFLRDAEVASSA